MPTMKRIEMLEWFMSKIRYAFIVRAELHDDKGKGGCSSATNISKHTVSLGASLYTAESIASRSFPLKFGIKVCQRRFFWELRSKSGIHDEC
ncbi:hypothetical protein AKJ16_DCAP15579 [Drosera capensis]